MFRDAEAERLVDRHKYIYAYAEFVLEVALCLHLLNLSIERRGLRLVTACAILRLHVSLPPLIDPERRSTGYWLSTNTVNPGRLIDHLH